MHTKTQSKKGTSAHTEVTPQWVYDTLMSSIEPDLLSTNIQTLDEKYKGESAEDRKARLERYVLAFMIFDECLLDLQADVEIQHITERKKQAAAEVHKSDKEDEQTVQDIEEEIDHSDFRA